jgi:DNA-nicking Smr family endonuclease
MAKRTPSREELELWRHVTSDAKPLRGRQRPKRPPPAEPEEPPAAPAKRRASAPPQPTPEPPKPAPPALALDRTAGIDKRLAERLKRGQLPIEGTLDLHGLTQAEAHRRLDAFIGAGFTAGRRCLLVITGKGLARPEAGILREMLPRWLNEAPNRGRVLAIARAQPRHGGTGALYLLLKRQRTES